MQRGSTVAVPRLHALRPSHSSLQRGLCKASQSVVAPAEVQAPKPTRQPTANHLHSSCFQPVVTQVQLLQAAVGVCQCRGERFEQHIPIGAQVQLCEAEEQLSAGVLQVVVAQVQVAQIGGIRAEHRGQRPIAALTRLFGSVGTPQERPDAESGKTERDGIEEGQSGREVFEAKD
ncbi:hypothetical protein JZ751_008737 [Albula glossodonta]|uniref:Uncharacterized protein n=1 Tax=Albula glossodonta TaxID=121402 RepID=A0A8T2NX40_9TELE|nr:hypothetical protein JZ751_008737 [Albula glossodonta]